jgi:hypothetical protein
MSFELGPSDSEQGKSYHRDCLNDCLSVRGTGRDFCCLQLGLCLSVRGTGLSVRGSGLDLC